MKGEILLDEEIWIDIKGYEGLYQVSNMGRVRSLDREVPVSNKVYKNNTVKKMKGKILKQSILTNNRCAVSLCKNNIWKTKIVHRLVANHFIANPDNLPEVNHKDGDCHNNNVDNLEWCSHDYNIKHSCDNYLFHHKPVVQILNNKIIARYETAKDAEKATGISYYSIRKCCKGYKGYNCVGGYKWKYIEDL